MKATPADLLNALLDACRRGLVTHYEGARFLEIRKEDFGDLVEWRMIEVALWRTYESAFLQTFPECNPALYRQERVDPPQDRSRAMPSECRHFAGSEAANLPPSQPHLDDRLPNAALDFAEPENADPRENRSRTFAPRESRAPSRDHGWQPYSEQAA